MDSAPNAVLLTDTYRCITCEEPLHKGERLICGESTTLVWRLFGLALPIPITFTTTPFAIRTNYEIVSLIGMPLGAFGSVPGVVVLGERVLARCLQL
jgi:hypothetical protein